MYTCGQDDKYVPQNQIGFLMQMWQMWPVTWASPCMKNMIRQLLRISCRFLWLRWLTLTSTTELGLCWVGWLVIRSRLQLGFSPWVVLEDFQTWSQISCSADHFFFDTYSGEEPCWTKKIRFEPSKLRSQACYFGATSMAWAMWRVLPSLPCWRTSLWQLWIVSFDYWEAGDDVDAAKGREAVAEMWSSREQNNRLGICWNMFIRKTSVKIGWCYLFHLFLTIWCWTSPKIADG